MSSSFGRGGKHTGQRELLDEYALRVQTISHWEMPNVWLLARSCFFHCSADAECRCVERIAMSDHQPIPGRWSSRHPGVVLRAGVPERMALTSAAWTLSASQSRPCVAEGEIHHDTTPGLTRLGGRGVSPPGCE